MTSIYPRLLHDRWQARHTGSSIDHLGSTYRPEAGRDRYNKSSSRDKVISRITHDEEQLARDESRVRNYGAHWLRPYGILKTIEQVEDEERELDDSYEEYEDEEGEVNQNVPETAILAGQESLNEITETNADDVEPEDLDDNIEEGASFEVDSSFVSTTSPGLHANTNGMHAHNMLSSELDHLGAIQSSHAQDDEILSAESGSIGEYSDLSE